MLFAVAGSVDDVPPEGDVFFFTPGVLPNCPCTPKIGVRSIAADLPPSNEATPGAGTLGGRNQGRARDATRKAGAGGARYPKAPRSRSRVGWGKTVAEAVKRIGATEQTYYRWKKKFGGLRMDQAKRLRELEKENSRLK